MSKVTKDEILQGFTPDTSDDPLISADELKQLAIEDSVAELRQQARQGPQPPPITPQLPNPKQEALVGTQRPRQVGIAPGTIEAGVEGAGGAAGAYAGAIRGAQYGRILGLPGAVAGGILGAGLGIAGTRAGVEETKHIAGLRGPITADEAIAGGQRAFLEGAGGEGVFRLLGGIPQLKHAMTQRLLGGAAVKPAEQALFQEAAQRGIHLTPASLSDAKAPQMVEATLRRTLGGSEKFNVMDIQNEERLRTAVDQWADASMGTYRGPVEQGQLLQKILDKEIIPEQKQLTSALYKRLDQQTGDAKIVDTTDLYTALSGMRNSLAQRGDTFKAAISALDDVITRITKKGNVTGLTVTRDVEDITSLVPGKSKVKIKKTVTQPSLESVERGKKPYDKGFVTPEESQLKGIKTTTGWQQIPTGEQLKHLTVTEKSDAPRQPINLSFSEAQQIRSILGSEIGSGGPSLPARDVETLKNAYRLMSEQMGRAATDFSRATGRDINLSWLLADTMNKRGHALFNESVLAKIVERNPEDVVKTVFQKDAITETRDVVRALETRPAALNAYRRGTVEELIKEATNKETERVVGTDFAKAARKRGEAVLKETYGEHYPAFKQMLEIAERLPKQKDQGLAWFEQGLYITGTTAAITSGSLGAPWTAATALALPTAWFLSTKHVANILTNKDLTAKLLATRTMDPRSNAFMRTMTQLGAVAVGESGQPQPQTPPQQGALTNPLLQSQP